MPVAKLCDFIGNVLPSREDVLSGPPAVLFSCCTCRRKIHRLQAAVHSLGPKPVACTGSFYGLLQEKRYVYK
jgi:hypothetical protein